MFSGDRGTEYFGSTRGWGPGGVLEKKKGKCNILGSMSGKNYNILYLSKTSKKDQKTSKNPLDNSGYGWYINKAVTKGRELGSEKA